MKQIKRILILTLVMLTLVGMSSVCAGDVNDTAVVSDGTDQAIEEVNEDIGELENRSDVLQSADEDVVSMSEDSWFYDDVVWYDGDYEQTSDVFIVFTDDLKNPEKITMQLCYNANSQVIYDSENPDGYTIKYSDYKNPIANVDLAILNDYDHKITKLTTNSNGIAVYNIPFDTDEFSVCAGFWHEDHVANYANVGETTINAINWGTWNKGNCINGTGESTDKPSDDSGLNVDDSASAGSGSKSYDVSSIEELKSALSDNRYENVIINLKSDIEILKNTIDISPSIKALTINGNGKTVDGDDYPFMCIENDAALTVRNITIINCWKSYGGAIYNTGAGKLTVVNCIFENNHAIRYGGAIYNSGHNSIIRNCTFRHNYASKSLDSTGMIVLGGAIYNNGDNVTITDNTFENNYASTSAYRVDDSSIEGGAIYIAGDNAKITGNTFIKNSAHDKGGAIYIGADNAKITGNTFNRNSAGNGAAIYTYGAKVLIDSNAFKLNDALSSSRDEPIIYMYRGGYYADVDKSDNIFVTDTECYSTIFHFAYSGAVITNNAFDDRLNTIIETSPNKTFPSEYNENNYLVITLKDETGEVLKGISLNIDFNGIKYLTTDDNGQIKLSTNGMSPNVYNAKITFAGDGNYAESTTSFQVIVENSTQKSDSEKSNTTDPQNSNNQNNNNNATDSGNGNNQNNNNNATDPGNGNNQNSNNNNTNTNENKNNNTSTNPNLKPKTKKATPKLTAKKATFKVKTKTKKYSVILKTNKNKAMKKVKLYLKVKGKTYTAKTNSNGKATFKITKLTKKGTYNAVITFKGNNNYKKVAKTVKIKVK